MSLATNQASGRRLIQRMQANKIVINGWLSAGNGLTAEIIAQQGYHSVTIDLQHGVHDYQSMLSCLHGLAGFDAVPMMRVAWNEPALIMQALDAGVQGIICPMVNTVQDAENFAKHFYFPPLGERSFGPIRAAEMHTDYFKQANQSLLALAQIETKTAMENLAGILDTPGISGVYVGPADLSLSYGYGPGAGQHEPEMLGLIQQIAQTAKKHQRFSCIHTYDSEFALKMVDFGFNLITLSNDLRAMKQGFEQILQPVKQKGLLD